MRWRPPRIGATARASAQDAGRRPLLADWSRAQPPYAGGVV